MFSLGKCTYHADKYYKQKCQNTRLNAQYFKLFVIHNAYRFQNTEIANEFRVFKPKDEISELFSIVSKKVFFVTKLSSKVYLPYKKILCKLFGDARSLHFGHTRRYVITCFQHFSQKTCPQ